MELKQIVCTCHMILTICDHWKVGECWYGNQKMGFLFLLAEIGQQYRLKHCSLFSGLAFRPSKMWICLCKVAFEAGAASIFLKYSLHWCSKFKVSCVWSGSKFELSKRRFWECYAWWVCTAKAITLYIDESLNFQEQRCCYYLFM